MDDYAYVHFLVLALLAPVLLLCGTAAQILRLPLITGYVLGGIIVGPYCLGILNADALQALAVVSLLTVTLLTALSVTTFLQARLCTRLIRQRICAGGSCLPCNHCLLSWGGAADWRCAEDQEAGVRIVHDLRCVQADNLSL